jgi:release factor glutamine methyltransferase
MPRNKTRACSSTSWRRPAWRWAAGWPICAPEAAWWRSGQPSKAPRRWWLSTSAPGAVRCARANTLAAGVDVDVHLGSWTRAVEFGPFDVVVCNPPYVPHNADGHTEDISARVGPHWVWNAGYDGRLVLDPLCRTAPALLDDGGTMLVVQSEFSGIDSSLRALRDVAMAAEVVAEQWIPFGPVLSARARWLERVSRLEPGRRDEKVVVIRAEKS